MKRWSNRKKKKMMAGVGSMIRFAADASRKSRTKGFAFVSARRYGRCISRFMDSKTLKMGRLIRDMLCTCHTYSW